MKRILIVALTFVVLLTTTVVPSFAITKADILAECEKSPVYKYVKAAVENAAKSVEITDEQAEQIYPLVKEAVQLLNTDNGPTHFDAEDGKMYDDATTDRIMEIIDEICKILGFTWEWVNSSTIKGYQSHINDNTFTVYDQNGNIIFQYDGDTAADTSAAATVSTSAWAAISAGAAMTLAAAVALIIARKKSAATAA